MEALIASYRENSSDSDSDKDLTPPPLPNSNSSPSQPQPQSQPSTITLPPPPLSLLDPPNSLGAALKHLQSRQSNRVRSFPHVEGNYALHVYIPVHIPSQSKKLMAQYLKMVTSLVPGLHVVDVDIPLNNLLKDDVKLEEVALGREFHISLGRTVPIRVHQIDSMVARLRQKLQSQRRFWIDFSKWEVFVNDDCTRTFLSLEVVAGGLTELTKQIRAVNEVYKRHNLPEFYKDPRPHISVAWALGDINAMLKGVIEDEMKRYLNVGGSTEKRIFSTKFCGIDCRIGQKVYNICKVQEER